MKRAIQCLVDILDVFLKQMRTGSATVDSAKEGIDE